MPHARTTNAVRLEFAPDSLVRSNLSGAAFTGDWLWVAGDEACGLDRLRRLDPVGREALRFGEVRDFPLADLLDLPGTAEEEADLEGMAVADGFLWVVGSHGLKRKNAKPDRDHADNWAGPSTSSAPTDSTGWKVSWCASVAARSCPFPNASLCCARTNPTRYGAWTSCSMSWPRAAG